MPRYFEGHHTILSYLWNSPQWHADRQGNGQTPTIDNTAIHKLGFGLGKAPSIGMQSFLGIVTCVDKTHVDLPLCAKSVS